MTLITAADVPPMLKAGKTTDDVTAAINWACSAVESYCERSFEQVIDDIVRVDPFMDRTALLPDPPVTAISLVEAWIPQNGAMAWVTLSNYDFDTDGLLWDTTGLPGVTYQYPSWPVLPNSLRVTYTHGFATIPQPVKDAAIKAVGLYLANPLNLIEKRIDDVDYRWGAGGGAELFDDAVLSKYRLVSIG